MKSSYADITLLNSHQFLFPIYWIHKFPSCYLGIVKYKQLSSNMICSDHFPSHKLLNWFQKGFQWSRIKLRKAVKTIVRLLKQRSFNDKKMLGVNCTGKLHLLTNANTLEQKRVMQFVSNKYAGWSVSCWMELHVKLLWKFP